MAEYYSPDGKPIEITDWIALWDKNKIVAKDEAGDYSISTVYLGLNHAFGGGPPLIFETMLFGDGPRDNEQYRYSTREQAVEGHERLVKELANG